MFQKFGISLLISFFYSQLWAQDFGFAPPVSEDPVQWEATVLPQNDSIYTLQFTANIAPDWHLYCTHSPKGGSQAAILEFEGAGTDYDLLGPLSESETQKEFSEVFGVTEEFFAIKGVFSQQLLIRNPALTQIVVNIDYQVCKELCIAQVERFVLPIGKEVSEVQTDISPRDIQKTKDLILPLTNKELLKTALGETEEDSASVLWTIFSLGLLGGAIALLTPCVFPMIPLTVSFFTKGAANRKKGIANALWYGFFIVLIYVLLSVPFHLFQSIDAQILNTIATNIWLNVFFFLIFIFFAGSFFGFYELNLPASWSNKMDDKATKLGGILGVFFMALTLALVSFSCTGPILGGLLGSTTLASGGDVATNLSVGMLGFGVALAFPFALFALFPGMLSSLPKSGGWMLTVKVFLGFVELGLAFKFLSNADLVGHWGLLKREIFLGIWLLISFGLALYLLGIFDKNKKRIHWSRYPWIAASIVFAAFMFLGVLKQSPLTWLSGFPPPSFYSVYEQETDCPLGLSCYKDFESGLAAAKAANKPILLDFTGWACVNCRRMEENVWSVPQVYDQIKNDFVLISLYVDDREPLKESEQFIFQYSTGRQKSIKTVGQKWGTFQTINFNAASQPYYLMISPNYEILGPPIQYTDAPTYEQWLSAGLETFKK